MVLTQDKKGKLPHAAPFDRIPTTLRAYPMYFKTRPFASLPAFVLSLASLITNAHGWGPEGHEIVATIAQIYTEPAALANLCQILSPNFDSTSCHLASIANWADTNKRQMLWSAPLHFVGAVDDQPPDACVFPGPNGWAGTPRINVLAGVHNTSQILVDWVDNQQGPELAEEALKFIVHFLGDMHMPLHMTGRLRGGNQATVCFNGRKTNLHSSWDDDLPEQAIARVPANYSRPLPLSKVEKSLRGSVYDPYVRRIIWEGIEGRWAHEVSDWISCPLSQTTAVHHSTSTKSVWKTLRDFFFSGWIARRTGDESVPPGTGSICPYHWAVPTHELLCELIWPKALEQDPSTYPVSHQCTPPDHEGMLYEINNADYMGPIEARMLLEQQLAKGGLRLAAILNYIFGKHRGGVVSPSSTLRSKTIMV